MKNVETITGTISMIERAKSSREGNPRYRITISTGTGADYESVTAYTEPNSALAYEIGNYREGQAVEARIGWHYGTVTVANIK